MERGRGGNFCFVEWRWEISRPPITPEFTVDSKDAGTRAGRVDQKSKKGRRAYYVERSGHPPRSPAEFRETMTGITCRIYSG
jgi:hypothetical protein